MSVQIHGTHETPLTIDERVAAYVAEARRWHDRYGRPFWVAETSNLGLAVDDGPHWLASLLRGIGEVTEVGLFDMSRRPRAVARAYADLASRHSNTR